MTVSTTVVLPNASAQSRRPATANSAHRSSSPADVKLPRYWSPVVAALASQAPVVRVVTPAIDCRCPEVALGLALSLASSTGGDVWLVASSSAQRRVARAARSWEEQGAEIKVRGDHLQLPAGSVWFEEPPAPAVAGLIVADAHAVAESPLTKLGARLRGPTLILGMQLPRAHWARALRAETVRLDGLAALAAHADQADAAALPGALDVAEEDVQRAPFMRFARDRLYVRSDKTRGFLSPEQQEQAAKQLGDFWHTGKSGTPTVSFHLSDMQRRYLARKRLAVKQGKPARFILLKYRRGGFTTLEQALSYYECTTAPNVECATLAHTKADTARIFEITTRFHENDPSALRRTDDSRSKLTFGNGSSIFTGTAGGHGFARGATLRRVHGSEVSQWCLGPNQASDVNVLVAGLLGAASNGEVVLESTPNGVEWFCQTYRDAKRGLNDWTPIFLPWFEDSANRAAPGTFDADEIKQTLSDEELELVAKHKLQPDQIAWRRATAKGYGLLFKQEYPEDDESCFLTSGICYFNVRALTTLLRSLPAPILDVERRGYRERRWENPVPGVQYVAGCDTSEGIPGCDPCGVGILRADTGEQVCSVHGYLSPPDLAEVAARTCREYNEALLGVERNNHGHAVLQKLSALGYSRPHFFGGPLYHFHQGADLASCRAGWDTNSETRPRMLAALAEAVEQCVELGRTRWVKDPDFVTEALSFRLQPSGKFAADSGAHDDSVMKWAIAWQMRMLPRVRPTASRI